MSQRDRSAVATSPALPGQAPIFSRRSHLELDALTSAVPHMRQHARQLMQEWCLAHMADTVELVTCELVTNAIHASERLTSGRPAKQWAAGHPHVRLTIEAGPAVVLIQTWDASDRLPIRSDPGPDADGGRGLLLVEALAADWGWYTPRRSSGKVVWATIQAEPPVHDGTTVTSS